ncbi:MAG: GNAT family N-acetyltransferase, partial [Proteobacteria bacterium]|nr:GNAT family N-acetyltransferase [Pseudomonadota bacterium]MBU1709209.1 GNAT family N-acetyltransferase [Pseudomonadota bacterium]
MQAKKIEIDWHPDLSVYASEPFLKATGDDYGWLGGFDGRGQLRCILPYTIIRKAIFRMVRFRVETISLGEDFSLEEEKSFLNSAMDFFRSLGADMIIPATTNTIFRTYPDGADAAPYGSYIIDLTQPEETLWGNLNTSHRRNIRQAMKKEVQVKSGIEYLDTAYELVRDTFKRSDIGFMDRKAFGRYVKSLGQNIAILVAEFQGEVQGCVVIPFSNHCAYYVYGGSIPKPMTGAMNLLHWQAIKQFHDSGVKQYDFVGVRINPEKGSKQEG